MNTPLPAIDIDTLEAGPDLDALVDEVIFGYEYIRGYGAPGYSTSIAAAWEVVEKLPPQVAICRLKTGYAIVHDDVTTLAPTAPLAICRAALKCTHAIPMKAVNV